MVELKRGRASDVVVGQILRYMGYVKEQIAESHQTVEGAIIALDDDKKLRWALLAVPNIRSVSSSSSTDFSLVRLRRSRSWRRKFNLLNAPSDDQVIVKKRLFQKV